MVPFSRRRFLKAGSLFATGIFYQGDPVFAFTLTPPDKPLPVSFPHFPDRISAFIWRNWDLVPAVRLAKVIKASPEEVNAVAKDLGLGSQPAITEDQQRRSYLTVVRRNWHLLPRHQILELMDWTEEHFSFILQEDDFFWVKLGRVKPDCVALIYATPGIEIQKKYRWFAETLRKEFNGKYPAIKEPLFRFVSDLSVPLSTKPGSPSGFSPRYGYSYFALYGDPLMEPETDPYPDGLLSRLAASGMDGVWLQAILFKLAPFSWDPAQSAHWEERLANLKKLVARLKKKNIRLYLYLNEPRSMPLRFFDKYPELKGVTEGEYASMCTSHPDVQAFLIKSISTIVSAVPDLGGFFTISGSENLSNCWSHYTGSKCPRCSSREPGTVIAELHILIREGIREGMNKHIPDEKQHPILIAWDWGWKPEWAESIISGLPKDVSLMSVSEWDVDIERGGIKSRIGEYSISAVGPGPRAKKHWQLARDHKLKTMAKVQVGSTWEIAAVPYIPALENIARHAVNLRNERVGGLMLGWTLGGYPSPNLEIVNLVGSDPKIDAEQAMQTVARNRYGQASRSVVKAWKIWSAAFSEFPFGGGLYYGPMQTGPSNLLYHIPTGYSGTMVGIPYDDIKKWSSSYGPEIFSRQLLKVADGFEKGLSQLRQETLALQLNAENKKLLELEMNVAEAIFLHFKSAASQVQFTKLRDRLLNNPGQHEKQALMEEIKKILRSEMDVALQMYRLQARDSRMGFEASNHYFYIPADLAEKVLNCRYLMDHWLPSFG